MTSTFGFPQAMVSYSRGKKPRSKASRFKSWSGYKRTAGVQLNKVSILKHRSKRWHFLLNHFLFAVCDHKPQTESGLAQKCHRFERCLWMLTYSVLLIRYEKDYWVVFQNIFRLQRNNKLRHFLVFIATQVYKRSKNFDKRPKISSPESRSWHSPWTTSHFPLARPSWKPKTTTSGTRSNWGMAFKVIKVTNTGAIR